MRRPYSLTVAGAVPEWLRRVRDAGVTGFPFQPLDEDPRATLELAALYGMDEPGSESTFHPNPPAATYHPESRL